jgi:MFS family permease
VLVGLGALAFLILLIEGAMSDWSGVFLSSIGKAPPGIAAMGYAAFSIAMAAGRLIGDRIVHRFGGASVLQLGAALTALGLTLAIADPTPMTAMIGFALVGLGAANVIPLLFGAGGQVPGTPAGASVAMVATLGYAGFLSGPPLIGFLAELVGLRAALCVLPFSAAVVAIGAARIVTTAEDRRGARHFRRLRAPADRERAPAAD